MPGIPPQPFTEGFAKLIGIEVTEATEDAVHARVEVRPELLQPAGLVDGGVYATIAEDVCSAATHISVNAERGAIAMGLSNEPELLIADEPTTALDVTVQAQIIQLLKQLNRDVGAAIILITHNMALVASLCQRIIVMYAGRIVEEGPVEQIFDSPQHPYTWSLLRSVPRVDVARIERLVSIKGLPPDLVRLPPGCKFHPRCRFKIEKCEREEPPLEEVAPDQEARCWVMMRNVSQEQREETKAGEVSQRAATELKEAGSA